jgi:hypothetical protein
MTFHIISYQYAHSKIEAVVYFKLAGIERWTVCTPISVKFFVTLTTQYNL